MNKNRSLTAFHSRCSTIVRPRSSVFRPWWVEPTLPPLGPEDEDVARERDRVRDGKAQSDILTMMDLSKVPTTGLLLAVDLDQFLLELLNK